MSLSDYRKVLVTRCNKYSINSKCPIIDNKKMELEDNFLLRWTDFTETMPKKFRELRLESELFDVTIGCSHSEVRFL